MSDETIRTLAWTVTFIFAIHAGVVYALVRFLITGKAIFERREQQDNVTRIHRVSGMDG